MLKKMEMMKDKRGTVSIEKRRGGTKLYYSLFYSFYTGGIQPIYTILHMCESLVFISSLMASNARSFSDPDSLCLSVYCSVLIRKVI